MSTRKKNILEEANTIIHGARNKDYGHPADNHQTTADMVRAYIKRRHGADIPLTARDICHFNILQKVSRDANAPKRDSLVDIAGYAGNIEMIAERGD